MHSQHGREWSGNVAPEHEDSLWRKIWCLLGFLGWWEETVRSPGPRAARSGPLWDTVAVQSPWCDLTRTEGDGIAPVALLSSSAVTVCQLTLPWGPHPPAAIAHAPRLTMQGLLLQALAVARPQDPYKATCLVPTQQCTFGTLLWLHKGLLS